MIHNITLQQLESFLWKAVYVLRGRMDASEYKDHIFLKRPSDAFEEARERVITSYKDRGRTEDQTYDLPKYEGEHDKTFGVIWNYVELSNKPCYLCRVTPYMVQGIS